jgi:hypothetical protein
VVYRFGSAFKGAARSRFTPSKQLKGGVVKLLPFRLNGDISGIGELKSLESIADSLTQESIPNLHG